MLLVLANLILLFTKSNTVVSVAQPFPEAAPVPSPFCWRCGWRDATKCSLWSDMYFPSVPDDTSALCPSGRATRVHSTKTTALTPRVPHPHDAAERSGTLPGVGSGQFSSATFFNNLWILTLSFVTTSNTYKNKKKMKRGGGKNPTLCKADCQLCLLI